MIVCPHCHLTWRFDEAPPCPPTCYLADTIELGAAGLNWLAFLPVEGMAVARVESEPELEETRP